MTIHINCQNNLPKTWHFAKKYRWVQSPVGELRSFRAFKARQRQRSLSYYYRLCLSHLDDSDNDDGSFLFFLKPDYVGHGDDYGGGVGKN